MKYYELKYNDILEGVTFKFKKMNPVEHLSFVLKLPDNEQNGVDKAQTFIQKVLENCLWSKDEQNYFPLVAEDGSARLPELIDNPQISLIMFARFKQEVLVPVFTESKIFQKK